jgi:predicted permease
MIRMSSSLADLRYALRVLRKNPGFTAIAILALALGVGANTAIFSVVDAVLLRPLPYADPDRLVIVWEDATHLGFPRNTPALANFVDWKQQNRVFTDMAALRDRTASLTEGSAPEQEFGRAVTPNFFSVMGVQPVIGRAFTEDEDRLRTRVVVISYPLWQRRFSGDPGIVGRAILMNNEKTTVLGVMPRGFSFPSKTTDFWAPANFSREELASRGNHYLSVAARLKPGVSVEQAQAEMAVIAQRLEREYRENRNVGAVVVPLKEQLVGDTRIALIVLLAAAGCVLLIACANLANLLLAKASERRREIAVRMALGAGQARLFRQIITESLLLAGMGGALGIVFAHWGMAALRALVPSRMAVTLEIDLRLLFFALAISLLTGLAFGAVPALQLSRVNLNDSLKQGRRGDTGGRNRLFRDALVVSEVALALVLLVGAGLLIQTLMRLRAIDPGFRAENLLTMETVLSNPKYRDPAKRQAYYDSVLERMRSLPGVVSAGFGSNLPFTARGNSSGFRIEGRTDQEQQDSLLREGTRDYLKTLGAQLREGRLFGNEDRANSLPVAIINETFADYGWPGASPIGKRIQINDTRPQGTWYTVVGVVREIRERGLNLSLKPGTYLLVDQTPKMWNVPSDLAIRTTLDPLSLAKAARQAIWSVDAEQPVNDVRTMEQIVDLEMQDRQQQMTLLSTFAALALLLASLGIYGVLSYVVTQRTREIGLRMALGASPGSVTRLVVGQGLRLTGFGLGLGAVAALGMTKLMSALLYGVGATDMKTYAAVSLLLGAIAAIACFVPARRAALVDPIIALREE